MSTSREPLTGATFILRCWLERSNWHYGLEEVGTGKRHGFASLDEFVSFLLAWETTLEKRKNSRIEADAVGPDS